jgi:hypothetical protein
MKRFAVATIAFLLLGASSLAGAGTIRMSDQKRPNQKKSGEIQTVAFGRTADVNRKLQWAIFIQASGSTCALDAPFNDLLSLYQLLLQAMRDKKATVVCSGQLNPSTGTYNVFFDEPTHMFQVLTNR